MPELAARRTVAQLVASDALGRYGHGVYRMPGVLKAKYAVKAMQVSGHGSRSRVGAGGLGGIAAISAACETVVDEAIERGTCVVGVSDYVGTTGSLGWYSYMLASRGVGSIIVCNSVYAVAIPNTGTPFGGTNPIAIGLPGNPPMIADYASTVMSYGDLRMSLLEGSDLPVGVVVDAQGNPSTRHDDANDGAMLGFGGHKGHVQSVAIEALCGMLAGSKIGLESDLPDGTVILAFSTDDVPRADAVDVLATGLRAASPEGRLPGSRFSAVPAEFLWTGEASAGDGWASRTSIELPPHVLAVLSDQGIQVGS